MASGTKHFLYSQREDWLRQGWMDGLTVREDGLVLEGRGSGSYVSMALDTVQPELRSTSLPMDTRPARRE